MVTKEQVLELGDLQIEATLRYKDTQEFLVNEFGNTAYQEMALGPVEQRNSKGQRVFAEPHTADLWHNLQRRLECVFSMGQGQLVIAALQLYSDKTLLNMKGQQAHPMRWVAGVHNLLICECQALCSRLHTVSTCLFVQGNAAEHPLPPTHFSTHGHCLPARCVTSPGIAAQSTSVVAPGEGGDHGQSP